MPKVAYKEVNFKSKLLEWSQKNRVKLEFRDLHILLQGLDLAKVDVNMFGAVNNQLVNDGCGLYKGRLILQYEHLSRFQNDIID